MLHMPADVGAMDPHRTEAYVAWTLGAGLAFAIVSVVLIWRPPGGRAALAFIIGTGLAMRAIPFITPPLLSTDVYRYVWDGRVQAAGINPYRYVPADPALESLRDPGHGPHAIYPNINRADYAPTIYPPVAQAIFAIASFVAPGMWGMKAVMLGFDLLAMGLTLLTLQACALPLSRIVLYAWNPLVLLEFAGGAHVDALAAGFSAMAILAAIRARPGWAGAALAGAVLCKLLPAAIGPALWRPRTWRMPVVAGAAIILAYAAYAGAGLRVLGFLPGYATEEGLGGAGVLLLRLIPGTVPTWAMPAYGLAGLVLLAALALRATVQPETPRVMVANAVWLTAAAMAVLSPHYPWYLSALAVPATVAPRLSAFWLMIAAPLLYLDPYHEHVVWPALLFLPAVATLAYDLVRHRLPEKPDVRNARGTR